MNRVEIGDCRAILRTLEAGAFRCCVTSPPYWGLRDYGTASWEGGEPACSHTRKAGGTAKSTLTQYDNGLTPETIERRMLEAGHVAYRSTCGRCGAVRVDAQIGLEPTPDAFVASMVDVFREVRRVLADDGTLWLNLGDTYVGGGHGGPTGAAALEGSRRNMEASREVERRPRLLASTGLKQKDLVGIPWMVAFALRADGWYLRSDIIWHKPNPMPESVTDRPTKAHEYLFLLSKSERYFYDADAIREARVQEEDAREFRGGAYVHDSTFDNARGGRRTAPGNRIVPVEGGTRNRRTVWTIPTEPYPGSHFATFPTALVTPCILAGSALGDAVLDPFMGSGTVGMVAESLGRRWFGCELNPKYGELIKERTAQAGLRFAP